MVENKRKDEAIRKATSLQTLLDSTHFDVLLELYTLYCDHYDNGRYADANRVQEESFKLISSYGFSRNTKTPGKIDPPAELIWHHIFMQRGGGGGARSW